MKIADRLEMLELGASNAVGALGVFNLTLVWDDDTVVLMDTGLPGQLENIRNLVQNAGVSFDKLSKIIITHQDTDHIGSLASIVKQSRLKIEVMSHDAEKPYIQGDKRPIKMTPERMAQLEAQISSLPEEQREFMRTTYGGVCTSVDTTVYDGQELPYCGGIKVIHTPGHTPGHICLYLKAYKALVTGDAMNVVEGKLYGPNPVFTYNMEEAHNSLKKLTQYDIETVICYHGGIFNDNANQRIAELVDGKDLWINV